MQALMKQIVLNPKELLESYREDYRSLRSHSPSLARASFRCGVTLFVLLPSRDARIGFFPEFHRVWWRLPFRWAKRFERTDELSRELKALGPRRACPFFAAATANLISWERVWSGSRANLEAQIEFVVPDDDSVENAVAPFLEEWHEVLGLEDSNCATASASAPDARAVPALTAMPTGVSTAADAQLLEVALDWLSSTGFAPAVAEVFPNLLEFMLPATLDSKARDAWQRVLDLRLQWLVSACLPQHYPHIQGLAAKDQWEREFVGEADPSKSRGRALIGPGRMATLFELGLDLEKAFPVLSRDPFRGHEGVLAPVN